MASVWGLLVCVCRIQEDVGEHICSCFVAVEKEYLHKVWQGEMIKSMHGEWELKPCNFTNTEQQKW